MQCEKALVGAFSVIVQIDGLFAALSCTSAVSKHSLGRCYHHYHYCHHDPGSQLLLRGAWPRLRGRGGWRVVAVLPRLDKW